VHEAPHVPPLQVAVPLVTLGHVVLQPPQCAGSLLVSVQVPPQVRPHAPAAVQHFVQPKRTPLQVEHMEGVHEAASAGPSAGASGEAESDITAIESSPPSAAALEPSSPLSLPASLPICPPSSPVEASGPR
jgi:hypothetical protein